MCDRRCNQTREVRNRHVDMQGSPLRHRRGRNSCEILRNRTQRKKRKQNKGNGNVVVDLLPRDSCQPKRKLIRNSGQEDHDRGCAFGPRDRNTLQKIIVGGRCIKEREREREREKEFLSHGFQKSTLVN